MNMPDIYRSMGGVIKQLTPGDLLVSNEETRKYGLVITNAEAEEIIEARNRSISSHGRVELGIEVVKKIIVVFSTSAYINRDEYAETISELVDIFYYMKNETEDTIGDDELIDMMQVYYNGSCQGSLDLLKNRELALFAAKFRRMMQEAEYSLQRSKDDDSSGYREI